MSWQAEFDEQWRTFVNVVETDTQREIEAQGRLDTATVNRIIQKETGRWSSSTHYNGAWLRNFKREHPQLGEEFQTALAGAKAKQSYMITSTFPIIPLLAVLGLTGTTFVAVRWLEWSAWTQILSSALVGLATASVVGTVWTGQRRKAIDGTINRLRQELEDAAEPLREITKRADAPREDPTSTKDGNVYQ